MFTGSWRVVDLRRRVVQDHIGSEVGDKQRNSFLIWQCEGIVPGEILKWTLVYCFSHSSCNTDPPKSGRVFSQKTEDRSPYPRLRRLWLRCLFIRTITSIPWVVRLSWIENAYLRQVFFRRVIFGP